MERFSPADLWREYQRVSAERRALRRDSAGASKRACHAGARARKVQSELARLQRQLKRALAERLIAGELVAYGQTEPPFGSWRAIPAAAWRELQIRDIRKGHVFGPAGDIGGVHVLEADSPAASRARDWPGTGAPGRPSSMHKVIEEFERRAEAGRLEPSLNRQAQALAAWLRAVHADMPPATAKTIANRLREAYRAAAKSG